MTIHSTHEKQTRLCGWSTSAELEFVWLLAARKDSIALLRGYLAGMLKRVEFGQIDPNVVVPAAQRALAELERRQEEHAASA